MSAGPLPTVIENLFPHRVSVLGIPRPRLQYLVTQKEARKLGFARAVIPEAASSEGGGDQGLSLEFVDSLTALVGEIAGRRTEDRRRGRM